MDFRVAQKALQLLSSPWFTNTIFGFSRKPANQFSSPSLSAWPEVPWSMAISAFTAMSSPKSFTDFAPFSSFQPRDPSA